MASRYLESLQIARLCQPGGEPFDLVGHGHLHSHDISPRELTGLRTCHRIVAHDTNSAGRSEADRACGLRFCRASKAANANHRYQITLARGAVPFWKPLRLNAQALAVSRGKVMANFTPVSAAIGGALIRLFCVFVVVVTGRGAGVRWV